MSTSNLIPRIGERIEQLDTAIFFGSPRIWRYPACIVRHVKMDRSGKYLWFKMQNISLDDEPDQQAPTFLFCYNKHLNFHITVEGNAIINGLAGDLKAPDGWQDPLFAHQITYLIRMNVRHTSTFNRPAPVAVPNRTFTPPVFMNKPPRLSWPSFLTGLF